MKMIAKTSGEYSTSKASIYTLISLALIACLSLTGCFEEDKREVVGVRNDVRGYKGQAAKDPYLAAQRLLQRQRKWAEQTPVVRFNADEHDAIVIPSTSIASRSQIGSLNKYLTEGGHFVVMLQYGDKDFKDFTSSPFNFIDLMEDNSETLNEWLNEHGLSVNRGEFPVADEEGDSMKEDVKTAYQMPYASDMKVLGESRQYELRSGGYFIVEIEKDYSPKLGEVIDYHRDLDDEGKEVEDGNKILTRSFVNGGKLTLIADARIFRNPYIGSGDHAAFLVDLLEDESFILFSSGRHLSFHELCWKYFPYISLAIIFLVAMSR